MNNYIITVARGFGSGGKEIARTLANELGINCYENRILTLASQLSGIDKKIFEEVNEKMRESKFSNFLQGLPKTLTPNPISNKFSSDDKLFNFQKEIIENLASTESCIIVGKCADWILKDYNNVLSVYIEAPRDFCINRIVQKMNVTKEIANKSIEKTDQYRSEYYQYYTHGNCWTNPINYDLTLNSQRLGVENCIKIIKNSLKIKFSKLNI